MGPKGAAGARAKRLIFVGGEGREVELDKGRRGSAALNFFDDLALVDECGHVIAGIQ